MPCHSTTPTHIQPPLIRHPHVEVVNMGTVTAHHQVPQELGGGEPEGVHWGLVQLELCMHPAQHRVSSHLCGFSRSNCHSHHSPHITLCG